jgi:hypothetical protein
MPSVYYTKIFIYFLPLSSCIVFMASCNFFSFIVHLVKDEIRHLFALIDVYYRLLIKKGLTMVYIKPKLVA